MSSNCPACGCGDAEHAQAHACRAALLDGDIDRAIGLGLLTRPPCPSCTRDCSDALGHARDMRLAALAARERFRARQQRLERRDRERRAARAPAPVKPDAAPVAVPATTALPPAVAALLARAKARAAGKPQP